MVLRDIVYMVVVVIETDRSIDEKNLYKRSRNKFNSIQLRVDLRM